MNDADGDGVCDEFEVVGCTDSSACNYENTATDEDGSCMYASAGYDCDGNCLVDSDGDGVCDQDEVTAAWTMALATTTPTPQTRATAITPTQGTTVMATV